MGHGRRAAVRDRKLLADRVVLATGTPVLDRGGFFARLAPNVAAALLTAGFDGLGLAPEVWSCAVLAVVAVVVAVTTVALRLRRADRE